MFHETELREIMTAGGWADRSIAALKSRSPNARPLRSWVAAKLHQRGATVAEIGAIIGLRTPEAIKAMIRRAHLSAP